MWNVWDIIHLLSFLVGANRTAVELHLLIFCLAGNNEGKKFIYRIHISFLNAKDLYQITRLLNPMVLNSTTRTRCLISARRTFLLGIYTRGYYRRWSANFVIFIIIGVPLTVGMESQQWIEIMGIFINVRKLCFLSVQWLYSLCQGMFGMELKNRGITGIFYPDVSFPSLECWRLSFHYSCQFLRQHVQARLSEYQNGWLLVGRQQGRTIPAVQVCSDFEQCGPVLMPWLEHVATITKLQASKDVSRWFPLDLKLSGVFMASRHTSLRTLDMSST